MNETMEVIFGLIGGLAMFLFGMNMMSNSLQRAAGEKMKKILSMLTRNALMGAIAGMIVTAVLQSSSATTVMVIGFVSAGLMSLPQAISVIFGANIGTTMTAQLLAFKISDYIYPIIFIGFIVNFLCKKEKVKNIGMVILSFGILFEGIEIMGSVMKPLASSPVFVDLMAKVADMPVLGVLLGAVMTLVVQSSSATIAVLQNFASQAGPDGVSSVMGLSGAIPILLGDNIGTTITALLASIGQSKNAKRTAVAHSVFNITGSIVFLFLIPFLTKFVQYISPKGNEIDVISRQIANAHTTFNIVCTLIWLPLLPVMVKIVTWIIRGDEKTEAEIYSPKYLDERLIAQPVAAMYLISEEISRLADYAKDMLKAVKNAVCGKEPAAAHSEFASVQTGVKNLRNDIADYTAKLLSKGSLTELQAEQTAGLLYIANYIDRIADRCGEIDDVNQKTIGSGNKFESKALEKLNAAMDTVASLFNDAMEAVKSGSDEKVELIKITTDKMKREQRTLNKEHFRSWKKGKYNASVISGYSDIFYGLERAADNCMSIAEEAADNISFVDLKEKAEKDNVLKEAEGNA